MNCDAVTSGLTESVLMKKSQCDPSLAPTPGLLDSWTFMEIDRFRLPFSATGLGVFSLTIFAKETIGVVLMLIPVSTFNKISNFHTSSRFFPYSKKLVASDWAVFSSNIIKDQLKWWFRISFIFTRPHGLKPLTLTPTFTIRDAPIRLGCCSARLRRLLPSQIHRKGITVDDTTLRYCAGRIPECPGRTGELRVELWRIKSYKIKNWSYGCFPK